MSWSGSLSCLVMGGSGVRIQLVWCDLPCVGWVGWSSPESVSLTVVCVCVWERHKNLISTSFWEGGRPKGRVWSQASRAFCCVSSALQQHQHQECDKQSWHCSGLDLQRAKSQTLVWRLVADLTVLWLKLHWYWMQASKKTSKTLRSWQFQSS